MSAGFTSPVLLAVGISGALVAVGFLAVIVRSGSPRMVFGSVAAVFVVLLVAAVFLLQGAPGRNRTHLPRRAFSMAAGRMESKLEVAMASVERARKAVDRTRRHAEITVSSAAHGATVSGWHREDSHAAVRDANAVVVVPSQDPAPPVVTSSSYGIVYNSSDPTPSFEIRLPPDWSRHGRGISSLLTALAIGAFLYLGYILLDASTRGHFTWSLRLLSLFSFSVLVGALVLLRHV